MSIKCNNFDKLSPEDRITLEEQQYRKQLIASHGFTLDEYSQITKIKKRELMP